MQTFVAHNSDAVLRPAPGHLIPGGAGKTEGLPDNAEGDYDGFFYALLEKGQPARLAGDMA
jgi:16S rRNA (cytosine967-C5)-methyltransferase